MNDLLTETYETMLNEATPFRKVGDIRSQKFTTNLPDRTKFRLKEKVKLGQIDLTDPSAAYKKYGAGAVGTVVGLQKNTPARSAVNRYYVQFEDGNIYPVPSSHLVHIDADTGTGLRPGDTREGRYQPKSKPVGDPHLNTKLDEFVENTIQSLWDGYAGDDDKVMKEALEYVSRKFQAAAEAY